MAKANVYALPYVNMEGWSPDEQQLHSQWPRLRTWDLPTDAGPFLSAICGDANPNLKAMQQQLQRFVVNPPAAAMPDTLVQQLRTLGLWTLEHDTALEQRRAEVAAYLATT